MTYQNSNGRAAVAALVTVALAASACSSRNQDTEGSPSPAAAQQATTAPAPTPGVTDANVAAIVVAANTVDIRGGEQALSKSSNSEVKKFAQRMVTDHSAVNQSAVALVNKLGVTPAENPTSKGLVKQGEQTRSRLSALDRAAFDRGYIANEVKYHQEVLNSLDNVLIPGAQNPELKATLVNVRAAFVAHLEYARRLQTSLGEEG